MQMVSDMRIVCCDPRLPPPLCTLLQLPLSLAVSAGHGSVVTVLLQAKANVEAANPVRETGLVGHL